MSEEQLKAFREKVKGDKNLQQQLKGAGDYEAVLAIAKAAGLTIATGSPTELQAHISDEELEAISGGGCRQSCSAWSINSVGTFTCL